MNSTSDYSTTRNITCEKPACFAVSQDGLLTLLKTPDSKEKIAEGGLRLQGKYKISSDEMPLITVITVVYNGAEFLEETIKSVIDQTYDNVEYIIVDGGSTDGTLDIICQYDHAIDYWVSEPDKGIYDAMNKGIDLGSGDWINFMNGGDRFYAHSVLLDIFSNPFRDNIQIIYGDHQVVYPRNRTRISKAGLVKHLWKSSQFCHQASFIEMDYQKSHKFNLCTKIVADFEFFYKAWQSNAKFKPVSVVVAKFGSGGVSDTKRIDSILGRWCVVEKSFYLNLYYINLIVTELFKVKFKNIFLYKQ